MEADAVNVIIVADKNALLTNMVCHPETGCFVVTSRNEVVAEGTPLEIPYWLIMTLVHNHALP